MDTKSVTLTVLVTIDVATANETSAIIAAKRFLDGAMDGADDGFKDGWNSASTDPEILSIRYDVEGEADVEEARP